MTVPEVSSDESGDNLTTFMRISMYHNRTPVTVWAIEIPKTGSGMSKAVRLVSDASSP